MSFKVIPVLDSMLDIYNKPRSPERFKEYLAILKGSSKSDLKIPIAGFNPMAKDHVIDKIQELKKINAEEIIKSILMEVNKNLTLKNNTSFSVFINVADDVKGGWTNYYTTDFDSKFKLNAFVERNFCVPYFWTSEMYSKEIIIKRTKEYIYRTIYWAQNNRRLKTLEDFVHQERFVCIKTNSKLSINNSKSESYNFIKSYYEKNKDSDDYNLIFNFMYGDAVCETLSYPTFGISEHFTGFDFVKH